MKATSFLALILIITAGALSAQPTYKKWDKNIAGLSSDVPLCIEQLSDSGFIILASSRSGIGLNKSQPNRDSTGGSNDFWLIRLDPSGNILWEKTYGGSANDLPSALVVLPNGYVLAGTSYSGISGEKTDSLRGVYDFWVVAVDSNGTVLWDRTIGGFLQDQLNAMVLTTDNNLLLAGWTLSGSGGDKASPLFGDFDYWLVKLDLTGNIILENTFGGLSADNCYAMAATDNGGALLAGYSNSPISFSKSQAPRGGFDYWVVLVDSLGRKLWDKTIGGPGDDFAFALTRYPGIAGGFLIGGDSFSGIGGEKSQACRGADDFWLVHLNTNGNFVWDKTYGGSDYDELNMIQITPDKKILLSGESYSSVSGEKTEANLGAEQIWMVYADTSGQPLWDKTFFTTGHDEYGQAIPTVDNCFIGMTYTLADTGGYRSFYNLGGGDSWICKLCYMTTGLPLQNSGGGIIYYPNPAGDFVNLKVKSDRSYKVFMTDVEGRTILFRDDVKNECRLDFSNLSAGIYLITVWTDKEKETVKLVKY